MTCYEKHKYFNLKKRVSTALLACILFTWIYSAEMKDNLRTTINYVMYLANTFAVEMCFGNTYTIQFYVRYARQ